MLFLLAACADPDLGVSVDSVEQVGDVPVYRVTFTAASPLDEAWVDFGDEGTYRRRVPATSTDGGTTWSTLVVGIAAGATGSLRPGGAAGGTAVTGEPATVESPEPPAKILEMSAAEGYDEPLPGYVVCSTAKPTQGGAIIYDAQTRVVWWSGLDPSSIVNEARLTPDGLGIEWLEGEGKDTLHIDRFDGTSSTQTMTGAHHSFVQLPNGGHTVIAVDVRDVDGVTVQGDAIDEYDADGNFVRRIWSTWDTLTPDPDAMWLGDGWAGGLDWVHLNSLDYDADSGDYLVSLYAMSAILRVDGETGAVEWTLGGDDSDYTLQEGDEFVQQHSPRFLADGEIQVFDNGPPAYFSSRVMRYALDDAAGTATPTWKFVPDPAIYTTVMGNGDVTPDGGLFISYGLAGALFRLDDTLTLRSERVGELGATTGFCHEIDSLLGDEPLDE